MKTRIASLLLAGTVALGAIGCSSDSTTPDDTTSTYFPVTAGSSWVYKSTELTGATATPTEGAVTTDSMYVNRTGLTMNGRTAAEMITVYADGSADTTYYSVDGGKIYQLLNLNIAVEGTGAIDLGKKWVISADPDGSEWTGIDTTITDIPINYNGLELNGTAKVTFKGSKQGTETVSVAGSDVSCAKYGNNFVILLTINTGGFGTIALPITANTTVWYGKNVGLVKTFTPPTTVNAAPLPEFEFPGSKVELTRYTIK